jgi:hypothetical protein
MDGVRGIGFQSGSVGELHDAAKLVSLGTRREVNANVSFKNTGNMFVEIADLVLSALLLRFGSAGLPDEGKYVDDHGPIVIWPALFVVPRELAMIEEVVEECMSKTQSTMVALGSTAPAFELLDVVSRHAVGRDDVFATVSDDARADGVKCAATGCHGLLVMFICVHCPYVKYVEEELARIGLDYEGKIAMVAISSNDVETYPQDSPEEMKKQAERLGFRFPYLYDETQEAARAYEAACTPDIFLFDGQMALVYRGQLDDSRPRRGDAGNDIPVTGKDLRAAMDAVIAGKRPNPNQRFAVGCNIKWKE